MIKAFIFDLDGVITDTAELHYLAWKRLADELGIYFDKAINESLKGVDRMGSLDAILGDKKNDFDKTEKHRLATQKNTHYQTLIKSLSASDILPGVETFLDELINRGYRVGMASASKNAPAVVESLGLAQKFEFIADAHQVKQSKPHPEVFQMVADYFDLSGKECVGVEDAYAGVQAINAAGMFAVGIGDSDVLSNAPLVYSDTTQLNLEQILSQASKI
ncbi:beta-phosphoglucomutase [Alteromonadaceae bacterium M269]|nr:beta-phosphoglucomutase [Alteromonadaceae bacterium M269]